MDRTLLVQKNEFLMQPSGGGNKIPMTLNKSIAPQNLEAIIWQVAIQCLLNQDNVNQKFCKLLEHKQQ